MCGYTALVRCVLALRCGSAGVMWYPYADLGLHKDTTSPQLNHTVTPTHSEPQLFTHTQLQAPEDECTSI